MSERAPRLDGVEYGVLALGDTAYVEFCAIGKANRRAPRRARGKTRRRARRLRSRLRRARRTLDRRRAEGARSAAG